MHVLEEARALSLHSCEARLEKLPCIAEKRPAACDCADATAVAKWTSAATAAAITIA